MVGGTPKLWAPFSPSDLESLSLMPQSIMDGVYGSGFECACQFCITTMSAMFDTNHQSRYLSIYIYLPCKCNHWDLARYARASSAVSAAFSPSRLPFLPLKSCSWLLHLSMRWDGTERHVDSQYACILICLCKRLYISSHHQIQISTLIDRVTTIVKK